MDRLQQPFAAKRTVFNDRKRAAIDRQIEEMERRGLAAPFPTAFTGTEFKGSA